MNKLKKILFMDKETWIKKRKQGLIKYLLITGLIKLGTVAGLLTISMIYLNDINYELKEFNTSDYLKEYVLTYYPITLLIGSITALLTWNDFESRFSN